MKKIGREFEICDQSDLSADDMTLQSMINSMNRRILDWLWIIRFALFHRSYEPELCQMINRIIEPGWVCVDVGANIGTISRALAKQAGFSGKVIAFEALNKNVVTMERINRLSRFGSVIDAENIAVSDGMESEVNLFPGRGSADSEWNIVGHDVDGNKKEAVTRIESTSLDNYFKPGSTVNFIKIDIEGAENLALRGMRRILRESRPVLFVEFHDETGWNGREELFAANYDLYEMNGKKLDPIKDTQRVYHCMAFPIGKSIDMFK